MANQGYFARDIHSAQDPVGKYQQQTTRAFEILPLAARRQHTNILPYTLNTFCKQPRGVDPSAPCQLLWKRREGKPGRRDIQSYRPSSQSTQGSPPRGVGDRPVRRSPPHEGAATIRPRTTRNSMGAASSPASQTVWSTRKKNATKSAETGLPNLCIL